MSDRKCIFNNTVDCDRFTHGEYVCMIFREKCENFKYGMNHRESESGDLISLAFKEMI